MPVKLIRLLGLTVAEGRNVVEFDAYNAVGSSDWMVLKVSGFQAA